MNRMRSLGAPVTWVLALALGVSTLWGPAAHAAMVGTGEAVEAQTAERARARVDAFLAREEVQGRLEALGVDPAQARLRVAGLSDTEAQRLAQEIDALPAGGADVLAVILIVFLVLLFTDIMGYTDVFPFVKKTAR